VENGVRAGLGIIAVIALVGLHMAALMVLLHPDVTPEYRAHYVERTSADWRVQHYPATPEQGIALDRPEWPEFVQDSYGITKAEKFGRWTDTRMGLKSGFKFNRSFEGPVCVVIDAKPSESMRGRNVVLAFGPQAKEVSLGRQQDIRVYLIEFALDQPVNTLEFRFPKPLPAAGDGNPRQVGIGLSRIQIFPNTCGSISQPTDQRR
jgi:hypothetical protein